MGSLTAYLQGEFDRLCPKGWICRKEQPFLERDVSRLLGFSPRADVCLEREDGSRRLWVEFEISRADPAANHVKFGAAHLFAPFPATDSFVSMVSAHVAPGCRNLGAQAVLILRQLGLRAHQTPLLPSVASADIKRINHLGIERIGLEKLDVQWEVERLFAVADPLVDRDECALHFAGNEMEVRFNLHRWNLEMATEQGRELWGRRTITYFVYDPMFKLFAPSKFCAYVMIPKKPDTRQASIWFGGIKLSDYSEVLPDSPLFDGQRARRHLVERLFMKAFEGTEHPEVWHRFENWLDALKGAVSVHPSGPVFISLSR